MIKNIMYDTDSYNDSHYLMYPPGTQSISGYMEPRANSIFNRVMFFGLQYYIKEYLMNIEDQMTQKNVLKAERAWNAHGFPFNRSAWEALRDDLDCKLPVEIQAVAEGSWIHKDNVTIQMQSTDERFFWLPTWLETTLVQNWFPCTVATSDKDLKLVIEDYLRKTGCENIDTVLPFMVHDFGFRGGSSYETTCLGGAAHLVNFMGTDTFPAILFINEYYSKLADSERMWGFSIAASNHAVITAWGKSKEFDAYQHIINTFLKEGKMVACVSDSYNFWAAIDAWGTQFKDQIMNSGGRLVVRPDCYDDKTEILTTSGWKLFKDLLSGDKVAQFDDGNISFVNYTRYIEDDYSGEMCVFTSDKYKRELVVTPNHRMVIFNADTGEYDIKEASVAKYYYKRNMCVAGLKEGSINHLTPYDRLMIAFQADGRCKDLHLGRPAGGKYILDFNFAKDRKTERLLKILDEGNFKYSIDEDCRRIEEKNPNWNKQVLINVYLDEKPYKRFNEWVDIENVSSIWCREFIDEVSNWDATQREHGRVKVDNTNKNDMELVQLISTFAGYRATFTQQTDNRSEKHNDVFTVHITKTSLIGGQAITTDKIDYSGKIYCVTVPSGILVVRRNNQIIISGNSGDPVDISVIAILKLMDYFGYTFTKTGFKLLPNCIRLIWGDGTNPAIIERVLRAMADNKLAAENIVFGMGAALLQKVDRDMCSFAFKVNEEIVNGETMPVNKNPVTGRGKASKPHRLALIIQDGRYVTIPEIELGSRENELLTVFRDGELLIEWDFEEIRERAKI